MKKSLAVLLCGIAVMVMTVILYFSILGNILLEAIHFVALVVIILAEIVTTAYACFANGSPRKVAATVVSGFMIPYAVILSVIYIVKFPMGYVAYLGWFFAGALVLNAIAFILIYFDSHKKDENDRIQIAKENMLTLRKIIKCILAEPAAQPYAVRLKALEENLHFSNDTVIAAEDEQIRQLLLQMQEQIAKPEFDCEGMLADLETAVDRRKIMTSRNV